MDAVNKQYLNAQLFIDGKFVDAAAGPSISSTRRTAR
jgi:phenylacetaldehyde dehydrogenase